MFSLACQLANCKCNTRLVLAKRHQTLPKCGFIPNISVTCNLNVSRIFVGVLNYSPFAWGVSASNAVLTLVMRFLYLWRVANTVAWYSLHVINSRFYTKMWLVFHSSFSRVYSCGSMFSLYQLVERSWT